MKIIPAFLTDLTTIGAAKYASQSWVSCTSRLWDSRVVETLFLVNVVRSPVMKRGVK